MRSCAETIHGVYFGRCLRTPTAGTDIAQPGMSEETRASSSAVWASQEYDESQRVLVVGAEKTFRWVEVPRDGRQHHTPWCSRRPPSSLLASTNILGCTLLKFVECLVACHGYRQVLVASPLRPEVGCSSSSQGSRCFLWKLESWATLPRPHQPSAPSTPRPLLPSRPRPTPNAGESNAPTYPS